MMSLRAVPALSFVPLLLVASLTRCQSGRAPEPSSSSSATPPPLTTSSDLASASASAAASAPRRPPRPQPHIPCRITEGVGDARMETGPDASAPLLVNGLAPQYWLDLPAGAHLVAKHPRTAREATFRGPGRVKVCVALEDESWVASGGFNGAAASSVVAPGSDEWIVTPFGVVRSATASLSVDVYPGGARIVISSGEADVWVPADASVRQGPSGGLSKGTDDWIRAGVDTFSLFNAGGAAALTLSGARAALGTCTTLAGSTRSRGRAACAVAGLRLGYLPPSSATASLNDQLTQGVALWNSLPDPSTVTPSP